MRPAAAFTATGPRRPPTRVFDPFWARVAESGITTVIHAGDSRLLLPGLRRRQVHGPVLRRLGARRSACSPSSGPRCDFLLTLSLEKLYDRHPGLRIASVENGSEFLPDLFRKLASTAKKYPGYFPEDPAETFRRHVWINPFWEDDPYEIAELMGADRVIFGSDWPHIEGMPRPLDYVPEVKELADGRPAPGPAGQHLGAHPPAGLRSTMTDTQDRELTNDAPVGSTIETGPLGTARIPASRYTSRGVGRPRGRTPLAPLLADRRRPGPGRRARRLVRVPLRPDLGPHRAGRRRRAAGLPERLPAPGQRALPGRGPGRAPRSAAATTAGPGTCGASCGRSRPGRASARCATRTCPWSRSRSARGASWSSSTWIRRRAPRRLSRRRARRRGLGQARRVPDAGRAAGGGGLQLEGRHRGLQRDVPRAGDPPRDAGVDRRRQLAPTPLEPAREAEPALRHPVTPPAGWGHRRGDLAELHRDPGRPHGRHRPGGTGA